MSSVYLVILLLIIIIMLIAPHPSSSSSPYLTPSVFYSDNFTQCGVPIPYPFGISNLSFPPPMPGFEINCHVRENMTLQLATTQLKLPGPNNIINLSPTPLKILNISQEGYLRVEISSILSCNQDSSSPNLGFSLEGTPYAFNNTANKFTVIGCDALVLIHSPDHKSSGCASFCATSNSVVDDGLCSGVGCCQASIPAGLKSFYVEFQSIRNLTHSRSIAGSCSSPETYSATNITYTNSSSPHDGKLVPLNTPGLCPSSCTRALVLEQDPFVFSASDVFDPTARRAHQYSVVLDWAIGNKTCEDAIKENSISSPYACMDNSYCYNVSTGGYRCSCKEGYTGNPYIGCEDIDECTDLQPHPCVGKCVNTKGNYSCPCPLGYTGNGKKIGEGCKRPQTMEIVLSLVLCFLFLLLVTSFWSYWFSSKRNAIRLKQKNFIQNGGLLLQQHISSHQAAARIFSAEELEEATENFDETRVLGRGGYGTVYRGILHDERVVAIKKAKLVDATQIEQFINEVVILSQIHHPNVVKLLGCCLETQVPLLVYEFISNGTLFHHVHGGDAAMPWETRLRIAIETAAALAYLHSAAPIPIIHRDIKSMNILLDENLTAKVSDFGASRLVPYNQTHVTTVVQGTMGYLDPEYFQTSLLTEKSDVYSFGVVLVELLTKKKPVDRDSDRSLASYFVSMVAENRVRQAVDRRTAREAGGRQLMAVADVARRCLSLKGGERPRMKEVEVELDALRRLTMKLDLVEDDQRSHEEEEGEEDPTPINDDAIKEWHVSTSDTIRFYTMESHLLSSLDLPR